MGDLNELPFTAYIGLDWADAKHDVCIQGADGDKREFDVIPHKVESKMTFETGEAGSSEVGRSQRTQLRPKLRHLPSSPRRMGLPARAQRRIEQNEARLQRFDTNQLRGGQNYERP